MDAQCLIRMLMVIHQQSISCYVRCCRCLCYCAIALAFHWKEEVILHRLDRSWYRHTQVRVGMLLKTVRTYQCLTYTLRQ